TRRWRSPLRHTCSHDNLLRPEPSTDHSITSDREDEADSRNQSRCHDHRSSSCWPRSTTSWDNCWSNWKSTARHHDDGSSLVDATPGPARASDSWIVESSPCFSLFSCSHGNHRLRSSNKPRRYTTRPFTRARNRLRPLLPPRLSTTFRLHRG